MNLHDIVLTVNRIVGELYGNKACCIFASGVLLDVLHALGQHEARPVRIEASARDRDGNWLIAGMRGRPAAATPGNWNGHMGALGYGILMDPTLDQISGQRPFSGRYDEDWEHAWYSVDETGSATPKYPGEGVYAVRYVIWDREGWRDAPDWRRKTERRAATERVLEALNRAAQLPDLPSTSHFTSNSASFCPVSAL